MKFFSLIKREEVHVAPDKKTIPADEFSKLVDADSLLKQTLEEEIEYRKEVAAECESLKEEAESAGFEEGLKQWNNQIGHLEEEIKSVRQEVENSLVPLALTAVKKILGRELEMQRNTVVDIISTALKAVSQHKKIKIYVNPSDYETVENARPRLKSLFEHLESLVISLREDIAEGGCIIETEAGIINAQLESQLKALETAFKTFFQNQKKKGG
ncbi:MAG: HrpE/YscL family type III secretion apparatus protein [Chlamydiales bacterium]|nr:HrpE/YscL family type III secretion apparatus protein [Chlamydiales bacterium]